MDYHIIQSTKGTRYMKGSKFCKVSDIPEEILQRLHNPVDPKACPFCGQPGTEEKTLDSVRYYLCLDDYNTKTTGELSGTIYKQTA